MKSHGYVYRPKDGLARLWSTYRGERNISVTGKVFFKAIPLWEAHGPAFVDVGVFDLQPGIFNHEGQATL